MLAARLAVGIPIFSENELSSVVIPVNISAGSKPVMLLKLESIAQIPKVPGVAKLPTKSPSTL